MPQTYENLRYRDITLDCTGGKFLAVVQWTQYFDLKGQQPPQSTVRDIAISNVKGRYGSFGFIKKGKTKFANITIEDVDVTFAENAKLGTSGVKGVLLKNVKANGNPID